MNSSPEWTVISRGFNTDDPQTVSEKQIIKYIRSETIAGGAQVCHEHTTRKQWMPLSETYLNEYVKQVQRSKDLHQIETKEIAKRKKRVSIAEQRAQDSETRAQEAELRSRNAEERANEAERKANEAERKANEAQTSVNDESFATSQEPPRVVSKSIPKMALEIKPTISDVNSPIEAKKRSVVFWVIVCVLSVAFFGTFGYIRQNRQFHDRNIQYWKTHLDLTHHDYVRALDRVSNSNNVTTEMLKESNALHEKWLLTQKHYVDALNDASK